MILGFYNNWHNGDVHVSREMVRRTIALVSGGCCPRCGETPVRLGFYNPSRNGDVHVSRELVRYTVSRAKADSYVYRHTNSSRLLLDIPGLKHEIRPDPPLDGNARYTKTPDGIYLNTWYAVSPEWSRGGSCTLNTLYALFQQNLQELFGISLTEPVEHFVPRIDFSKYRISGVQDFFASIPAGRWRRKVFVSNSAPMSGQSMMPPGVFEGVVAEIVRASPDTLFVLSNSEGAPLSVPNVVYVRDLIPLPVGANDLNECAFASTFCDVIVGRSSGAYTFAHVADNLFDETKTFVCFADDERTARWLHPADLVKATILWTNNYQPANMVSLIAQAIGQGSA